jgi:hypothetical protein
VCVSIARPSAHRGLRVERDALAGREPGQDLDAVLPPSVNWKAHNYTHLMEQPTIFYATVAILALSGAGGGLNTELAWAYTGIRIVHSIWQATVNKIMPVRFGLFLLSTACLLVLAVNAVRVTLGV